MVTTGIFGIGRWQTRGAGVVEVTVECLDLFPLQGPSQFEDDDQPEFWHRDGHWKSDKATHRLDLIAPADAETAARHGWDWGARAEPSADDLPAP